MAITTLIRGRILLLVSLLLLATATQKVVVGANVDVSTSNNSSSNNNNNNDALSSSFGSARRSLQDDSNVNDNENDNNIEHVLHVKGTAVQFQDQDGTWMLGVIWKYNDDTQTYTIQWDEDHMEEDFPDVNEVDELVRNAELYNDFPLHDSREQKEDSDSQGDAAQNFDFDVEYVPHVKGTAVQFQDQDGTWMLGVIWKYNDDTQTYTIQWDEDHMEEDFPDVNEVDELVRNAELYNDFPLHDSREQKEDSDSQGNAAQNFDFDFKYSYEDLSDYDPWPIGTPTLLEFADGWFEGKITHFDMSDDKKKATYIVQWSDGSSDSFDNQLEWMDLMAANAEDYQPWELGTPAYGYPNPGVDDTGDITAPNAYLSGEITAYENGAYTVTWSNGDSTILSDFDMVDQLVNNAGVHMNGDSWLANYDPYPPGTLVAWAFDDGWWDGSITNFSNGAYEVTWNDGSSKYYSNLEKIDQMVNFYNGGSFLGNLADPEDVDFNENDVDFNENDDSLYGEYYALQTIVYAEFTDGWWAGYIDSYEGNYYIVRWSDDSVDKFLPSEEMDEMVLNAQNIPKDYGIWPVGTHVQNEFDGTWFLGTIEYNDGGFYTILWDDGTRTTYVSGPEIDEMVKKAHKGGFGRFVLIIFLVLGSVGGIVLFGLRRNKKQRLVAVTKQVKENELVLREGDGNNMSVYEDQPAEGPPSNQVFHRTPDFQDVEMC